MNDARLRLVPKGEEEGPDNLGGGLWCTSARACPIVQKKVGCSSSSSCCRRAPLDSSLVCMIQGQTETVGLLLRLHTVYIRGGHTASARFSLPAGQDRGRQARSGTE